MTLDVSDRKHLRTRYLTPLIDAGWLSMTVPDKPRSSKQKYITSEKGKKILKGEDNDA